MKEEEKSAVFNAGMASAMRLDSLIQECNRFSKLCNMKGMNTMYLQLWKDSVLAFYREIYPKLSADDIKRVNKLRKYFRKIGSLYDTQQNQYCENVQVIILSKFNATVMLISKIETTLRVLADKRGLLIPNKASSRDTIGEM